MYWNIAYIVEMLKEKHALLEKAKYAKDVVGLRLEYIETALKLFDIKSINVHHHTQEVGSRARSQSSLASQVQGKSMPQQQSRAPPARRNRKAR
jgi:hypothetical protein